MLGQKPNEWRHQILRQEAVDGTPCTVVESTPLAAQTLIESGYSKRISWIAQHSFVPLKVDYFDPAGAPLKTLLNKNLKLVDAKKKKFQAMLVQIKNIQTGHSTTVTFEAFEANTAIAEDYFSHRYLEREE